MLTNHLSTLSVFCQVRYVRKLCQKCVDIINITVIVHDKMVTLIREFFNVLELCCGRLKFQSRYKTFQHVHLHIAIIILSVNIYSQTFVNLFTLEFVLFMKVQYRFPT